eukprot:gene4353-8663_t
MTIHKGNTIKKCEQLIRDFNPVTHSIDSYCLEKLGDVAQDGASEESIFIQQIIYGCQRQSPGLEAFISNFYGDNSARILRADRTLYTIFAYLAIFRLDELGFQSFKGYVHSQDPGKMFSFMSYLFNTDNLWSSLRSDWMKHYDLNFVEDEIIAGIELFIPEATSLTVELQERAQGVAAAQAAKEEARKAGTLGLGVAIVKESTRPVSPNISKPRPPRLPDTIEINTKPVVKDVPTYLERTSLADINENRKKKLEQTRQDTQTKYDEKKTFKFHETKSGRDIEDVRREVEEEQMKDVDFEKSFYTKPPSTSTKTQPPIRLNVAAILREDALYKKQQAKDAQILKSYEEDLRDSSEYYSWLNQMKARDEEIKLKHVALRREQTRQSAAQAKEAVERQRDDNNAVAGLMREQAEAIRLQRILEEEIRTLEAQQLVQETAAIRDKAPKDARERVCKEREEQSRKLREDNERLLKQKEMEDARETEERADKIRQQRAVNTILKKHIVIFDPTESSGVGLLDEMSYTEMKERLESERRNSEENTVLKRQEIFEEKQKKARELEQRAEGIQRARNAKAAVHKATQAKNKEIQQKQLAAQAMVKEIAAVQLGDELDQRRETRRREAEALKAEADRVRRQQQYLGIAKGHVDDVRAEQQITGSEREAAALQLRLQKEAEIREKFNEMDNTNKKMHARHEMSAKTTAANNKQKEVLQEKREAIEKLKKSVLEKKGMFNKGREQFANTKKAVVEHNPYAAKISEESLKSIRFNNS